MEDMPTGVVSAAGDEHPIAVVVAMTALVQRRPRAAARRMHQPLPPPSERK